MSVSKAAKGGAVRGEWAGEETKEKTTKDAGSDDAGLYHYEGNRKLLGSFQYGSNMFCLHFKKTPLPCGELILGWSEGNREAILGV